MSAVKDRLVNVPVGSADVINTVKNIPRTPREAGLIQVKLKRKLKYKNYHRHEYIDPEKIFKALENLRRSGHPYYQFYDDYNVYKKRCNLELQNRDPMSETFQPQRKTKVQYVGDKEIERITDVIINNEEELINETDQNVSDAYSDDEEEYVKYDPVRKFQFDHNISTCLTNKFPEMLIDDDGEEIDKDDDFSFAPGEGKTPKNILTDEDWDIKAWPCLHPDGKYGLHHKRKVRLTDQKYLVQRIRNKDRRFEENPGYVFAATSYIEKKRLQRNANISFSRGRKTKNDEGNTMYTLNDPYTVFDNVKNTPKYWQKYKYEMIAKLENLGPFQWFFTLSCADMKWEENFSSLLTERDLTIEYEVLPDGSTKTTVKKDGWENPMNLDEYLKNEEDTSLHEMIRKNVLNATRNFQNRVDAFIKEIIFGENNPMKIKNLSYKVEFQGRGAGHIHGVLWVNMSKFEKRPARQEDEYQYLTEIIRNLRDNKAVNLGEMEDLAIFVELKLDDHEIKRK